MNTNGERRCSPGGIRADSGALPEGRPVGRLLGFSPLGTVYKEVVERLRDNRVSAVPVMDAERRVIGVVSEADLAGPGPLSGPER